MAVVGPWPGALGASRQTPRFVVETNEIVGRLVFQFLDALLEFLVH